MRFRSWQCSGEPVLCLLRRFSCGNVFLHLLACNAFPQLPKRQLYHLRERWQSFTNRLTLSLDIISDILDTVISRGEMVADVSVGVVDCGSEIFERRYVRRMMSVVL